MMAGEYAMRHGVLVLFGFVLLVGGGGVPVQSAHLGIGREWVSNAALRHNTFAEAMVFDLLAVSKRAFHRHHR